MRFLLTIAFAGLISPTVALADVGYVSLADTSVPDRPLALSIWYPSNDAATQEIGGNAVFVGAQAAVDAPVPAGPLPLIIVSHGGLRSAAESGAWLSAALAQAGSVVVEVNAPRPKGASAAVGEIWKRPQDISRALDAVLASPVWQGRVDAAHISIVGVALGGTAALMVAGEVIDPALYAASCAEEQMPSPDCGWYAAQGVDLQKADFAPLLQSLRDDRVTAAIAIAPEYVSTFDQEAARVDIPVLQMSLGGPDGVASDASVSLQNAAPADAFALCTQAGPTILLEEGGDPALCGEAPASRMAVHGAVIDAIRTFQ